MKNINKESATRYKQKISSTISKSKYIYYKNYVFKHEKVCLNKSVQKGNILKLRINFQPF